jgi:GNAT superfamily N-acetyltransferase
MEIAPKNREFTLKAAVEADVPLILSFIKGLADYERLAHEMVASEDLLRQHLFGERPMAEVIIGYLAGEPVGFALFFHTFSTFLGRPGLYLEDLFIKPEFRGRGLGRLMLAFLAQQAQARNCGRLEWSVLDWNEPAINFYQALGAEPLADWTMHRVAGAALARLAEEF